MDGTQLNRFSGSCVSDLDYSDIKSNQLVFPTLNVRIFNKKGQGFIATLLPGNEYSWSVRDSYYIIGHKEYNGVLYIVSYSPSKNHGEIGSFPSPVQVSFNSDDDNAETIINTAVDGFVREYKSLGNYTVSGTKKRFNTSQFGFALSNQVDVIAKIDYDDSINLYLCDYKNPNRAINTGFDQNGIFTNRLIAEDDFGGQINLITSSDLRPSLSLYDVSAGGSLKPGNYFLYVRYATRDFNTTSFLSEFGPIQVGAGKYLKEVEGVQETDWLDNTQQYTDKKIIINVSDIDTSFKYIQLGVIRHSSFTENSIATSDIYLVDNYFTTSSVNESGKMKLTGNELQQTLTIADVLSENIPYNISKSHNIVNKRYIGSNWRTAVDYTQEVRDALKTFALKIVPSWDDSIQISDWESIPSGTSNQAMQYQKHHRTTNHLGYFRGQIYPFAIKFLFKGGYTTEAFPIRGKDSWNDVSEDNTKGLCRSKKFFNKIIDGTSRANMDFVQKIALDFTFANLFSDGNDLFDDVVGFYVVRADRVENLITQGILLPVINGRGISSSLGKYFDGDDGSNPNNPKHIPLYKGIFPGAGTNTGGYDYWQGTNYISSVNPRDKFALYSMDYMFSNKGIGISNNIYIDSMMQLFSFNESSDSYHEPPTLTAYQVKDGTTSVNTLEGLRGSLSDVSQGQLGMSNGFVGALMDGKVGGSDGGYYDSTTYNRSMFSPKYLGVDILNGEFITTSQMPLTVNLIVNIYNNKNDNNFVNSTVSSYSPETEEYSSISGLVKLNTVPDIILGGGDCFLQRTIFRQMRWFGRDDNPDVWGGDTKYYHGLTYSAITENKVNTAMRNEVDYLNSSDERKTYSFLPKLVRTGFGIEQWIESEEEEDQIEAFQINDGYNKTNTLKDTYGFDENAPVFDGDKRNRVYYSNPAISGSVVDQFREISLSSYQDFIIESGEIIAIEEYRGMLVGITTNKIFQIFTDENAINTSSAGDNILGSTASFISDRINILAEFGSQHQWSIVKTEKGIYGVDWLRRKIWRVVSQSSVNTGRNYLGIENLTETKFVQKWLYDLTESFGTYTDIVDTLDDNPINGIGIVTGKDSKFDEVLFTFLFASDGERMDSTLVFSELSDDFRGEYSATPPAYMNISNDLYTLKHSVSSDYYLASNNVYKHNMDNYLEFHDEMKEFKLSFIVNGDGEENKTYLKKVFENLLIEMNDVQLDSIFYETDYQTGEYDFKSTDIADKSEYIDYEWQTPITLQARSVSGIDYEADSELVGKWLKITLIYSPTTEAQEIYIKKVITNFDILFS